MKVALLRIRLRVPGLLILIVVRCDNIVVFFGLILHFLTINWNFLLYIIHHILAY